MPIFDGDDDDDDGRRRSVRVSQPAPVVIQPRTGASLASIASQNDPVAAAVAALGSNDIDLSSTFNPTALTNRTVDLQQFNPLGDLNDALGNITSAITARQRTAGTSDTSGTSGGSTFQPATGGSRTDLGSIDSFTTALRTQESGGNYQAIGPATRYGTAKGAYQFIDETWQRWAGRVGASQYRTATQAPPEVQDQVARFAFQQLFSQYGDCGLVAIAWHSGEGTANRVARTGGQAGTNDGLITTDAYAANILRMAGF